VVDWEGELNVMQQRIVCAANKVLWKEPSGRFQGEQILLGVRHWDVFMREARYDLASGGLEVVEVEQGFVDQHGKFLSRTEAWKVAEAAGQIIQRCGGDTADGGTLYSENLY
jgi:hypothetical protein